MREYQPRVLRSQHHPAALHRPGEASAVQAPSPSPDDQAPPPCVCSPVLLSDGLLSARGKTSQEGSLHGHSTSGVKGSAECSPRPAGPWRPWHALSAGRRGAPACRSMRSANAAHSPMPTLRLLSPAGISSSSRILGKRPASGGLGERDQRVREVGPLPFGSHVHKSRRERDSEAESPG